MKEAPSDNWNSDVLMARQAIMKSDNTIYGFEVLYRGKRFDPSCVDQGMGATSELLSNVFTSFPSEKLSSGLPLFINVDREFIESPSFFPTHSENIVLEILETVEATPEVIEQINKLKKQGFKFALDDFVFAPHQYDFLPFISILKVDVLACSLEELERRLPSLKKFPITLLAEKVEDESTWLKCKEMGFTLFQGYYLEMPKLVHGLKVPSSKQVTVKLLSELSRATITVDEVTNLISCDPRLAIKIVLLVNSSLFSFVRNICNIREAVVALGIEEVKRWAIILMLVSESESPIELFRILLSRAKALELYAKKHSLSNHSDYFVLGLFSGLDTILGVNIEPLLQQIELGEKLRSALTGKVEGMGKLLHVIKLIERFELDIEEVHRSDFIELNNTYWDGLFWADELMEQVTNS